MIRPHGRRPVRQLHSPKVEARKSVFDKLDSPKVEARKSVFDKLESPKVEARKSVFDQLKMANAHALIYDHLAERIVSHSD